MGSSVYVTFCKRGLAVKLGTIVVVSNIRVLSSETVLFLCFDIVGLLGVHHPRDMPNRFPSK